jgi:hypothetical protein
MSINEVSKTAESGLSATPEKLLSNDIFDVMVQSYKKEKQNTPDATPNAVDSTVTPETVEGVKADVVDFGDPGSKKIDEHTRLSWAVDAADTALRDNPLINKHVAKLEMQATQLLKQSWQQEDHIRDTVRNTFSKADMYDLSSLGPNPLDQRGKKVPFEFNNAQRAWIKEHHPDVDKLLEKHARTSLESSRVNENIRKLNEIKEGPVNARIDLARHQNRLGLNNEAISTLTEAINRNSSLATRQYKADDFRAAAIEIGAAFNPTFRNTVEHSGGNILDFVQRPMPPKPQGWKVIPKAELDFNPDIIKKAK